MLSTQQALAQVTKMDHVKVTFTSANNYYVNTSLVHPSMQMLDSGNLVYGSAQPDEVFNFKRAI